MTHADLYLLQGTAALALTTEALGKLAPSVAEQAEAAAFTCLDLFDQSLRRSNRMLLDIGTSLALIQPDGRVITQTLHGTPRFTPDLADGPVKRALSDLSPLRSLLPLGTGKATAFTLAFVDEDQKTHCRAALYSLTGAEGQTLLLVRPQGLRGYDKALTDLRQHLDASGEAFDMATLYALLVPAAPVPDPKTKSALAPGQTAFSAATAIIARQIPVAQRAEPGIIADHDTEFLHDYRVALRRIRSVLSLFRDVYQPAQTTALKARFATLMAQTGPLRDLDVLLLGKQDYYDLLPPSLHPGLDTMFALRKAERTRAHARLSRQLRSKAHAQAMTDLAGLFSSPHTLLPGPAADRAAQDFASSLIWKRFRKIRQIAASIGPDTGDLAVHALRIHCKKLRYLMEFFAGLFPGPAVKSVLTPLKRVQDHLGLVNDLSVQETHLQTFLQGLDGLADGPKLQVAQTVGALTTVLHRRKLEERQKTIATLSGFLSPEVQKTFRDLFHARKPKP